MTLNTVAIYAPAYAPESETTALKKWAADNNLVVTHIYSDDEAVKGEHAFKAEDRDPSPKVVECDDGVFQVVIDSPPITPTTKGAHVLAAIERREFANLAVYNLEYTGPAIAASLFAAGIGMYHRKSSQSVSARVAAIDDAVVFGFAFDAFHAGASVAEVMKLYDLPRDHAEYIQGMAA